MDQPLFPLMSKATTRRSFLGASTSLAAATLLTGCAGVTKRRSAVGGYPFSLGVASGDPSPDGFVLWTRLAPDPLGDGGMPPEKVEVSWIVAEDEKLSRIVRRGYALAAPEWAHSVHVEVQGLQPDRWYWYQFKFGSETSPLGRSRTTPPVGSQPEHLRFAFASCQHFEEGLFTAYQRMVEDSPDLIVHLGDYIYEGPGREKQIRRHAGGEILSVDDYRRRHAQYKTDPLLQAAHAAAPWLVTWDDHEVDNNYAGEISELIDVFPRQFLPRRAAAYQAFYEHMPVRRRSIPRGPDMLIYRRVSYGDLADFHVLDTRQYRTVQPAGGRRNAETPESNSTRGTLLGAAQKRWLFHGLENSKAKWNILAQQVMMGRVNRGPEATPEFSMDQWPGYEIERREILSHFHKAKIANPIVLTGDIHSNWANELTLAPDAEFKEPVAAEFVGTSLSSGGDGQPRPDHHDATLSKNPFVKFLNTQRGYVLCQATAKQWRSEFRTMDVVSKPGGIATTSAAFVVEPGSSKLQKA